MCFSLISFVSSITQRASKLINHPIRFRESLLALLSERARPIEPISYLTPLRERSVKWPFTRSNFPLRRVRPAVLSRFARVMNVNNSLDACGGKQSDKIDVCARDKHPCRFSPLPSPFFLFSSLFSLSFARLVRRRNLLSACLFSLHCMYCFYRKMRRPE